MRVSRPRHEGQTLNDRIPHSSLVNSEFDTFFAWCFWQMPVKFHERSVYPFVNAWLQVRPREYNV